MSIYNWYQNQVSTNKLKKNINQLNLIKAYDEFITTTKKKFFINVLNKNHTYLGFYIYGSFGSGKTMLLNTFFNNLNSKKKLRIHFHEFMSQINNISNQISIEKYCLQLKKKYEFIFLDEFHVSDIATAMLLYNILNNLLKNKIKIITTSNYQPDDLYKEGIMRERFIPAIALIKENFKIYHLEINQDFRQNESSFLIDSIGNNKVDIEIEDKFKYYAKGNIIENNVISIHDRNLPFIKKSANIIWFEFRVICGELRSQIDYIELVQLFDWFIIDNIYQLSETDKDIARRFTWLIDILYDASKKVIIRTNTNLDRIYTDGIFSYEFKRTISRLNEMQTIEYQNKPTKNILWET
jgi:cell division protein ZapE